MMNSITLKKQNQLTHDSFKAKSVVKSIAVFILAFASGICTVVKPIVLLAIPIAVILFAITKLVAICKDVLSISFETDGLSLSHEEILEDLYR